MENKKNQFIKNNNINNINNNSSNGNLTEKFLPPLYVYPLGGQGEVGKNCYCVEMGNEIFIIDAGIKFAQDSVSLEGSIPSFVHLERNMSKIKGLIITHGHEDHIGAVPHLLHQLKIPKIFAGRLTAALADSKIRERGVEKPQVIVITDKSYIKSRNFEINFFNVIHSIPDSFGLEIKTKHGTVVSTGDFKFDNAPTSGKNDIQKIAQVGSRGVTLLLGDSTNAETEKISPSETQVAQNIEKLIKSIKGLVIITTFASNVSRVREIVRVAIQNKRKICTFGWSMSKVVNISRKIKYINAPDEHFIDEDDLKRFKPEEVLILCTGGQGETRAALSKIANGKFNTINIKSDDAVIFSTNAIPGNFEAVEKLTNKLIKIGATVYDNKNTPGIHTTGHANKQDQSLMLNLIKPEYFMPIHGEAKMLIAHGKTAVSTGVDKDKIIITQNGTRVKIIKGEVSKQGFVHAEDIYVDDTNLTGQSNKVISDRKKMAKNGVAIVSIGINSKENKLILRPKVNLRGAFNEKTNNTFLKELEIKIGSDLDEFYRSGDKITFSKIKDILRQTTEEKIFEAKKLEPTVVPIILNVI